MCFLLFISSISLDTFLSELAGMCLLTSVLRVIRIDSSPASTKMMINMMTSHGKVYMYIDVQFSCNRWLFSWHILCIRGNLTLLLTNNFAEFSAFRSSDVAELNSGKWVLEKDCLCMQTCHIIE